MTCPPVWKWKPSVHFSRVKGMGWSFCAYQHSDHNPVVTIQRCGGKWRFEFYRDYFYMRALRKKYGDFR
ncbi:hypothetical protein [Tardiphaga sp. 839_C3_N1_4]|uniref:hypothetical protein n=1 Tax=Tardiphaga sp. 839_C3_N1_4 TaxID=3240761 RepID=UPI003F24891D